MTPNTNPTRSLVVSLLGMAAAFGLGFLKGRDMHPDYEYMNQRIKGARIREESADLKVEACERDIFHLSQQLLNCQTNRP